MASFNELFKFAEEYSNQNPDANRGDIFRATEAWSNESVTEGQSLEIESTLPVDPRQEIADQESLDQGFTSAIPEIQQTESPVTDVTLQRIDEQEASGLESQLSVNQFAELPELEVQHQLNPRARLSDQAEAVRSRESDFRREQLGAETRERRLETGTRDMSVISRLNEVLFTRDYTEGDRKLGTAITGLLSLPARELGALFGQGDVSEETSKLFKGQIKEVTDWAMDRENQNLNIDVLIGSLQEQLDKKEMSMKSAEMVQAKIDELADQKNSGALTATSGIIANLFWEIASDPFAAIGISKNIIKSVKLKMGDKIAKVEDVSKLREERFVGSREEAIKKAEQKLPEGEEFQPIDKEFVEQGMDRAVQNLKDEGLSINQGTVIGLPTAAEEAAPALLKATKRESDTVRGLAKEGEELKIKELSQRDNLVKDDIASINKKQIREGRDIEGIRSSAKDEVRDILEDTPKKIGTVEESASVDIKDLEGRLSDLRKGVEEGHTGIKEFDILDDVRSVVKISKKHKKDVIGDVINSMSPGSGLSDDLIESIIEGRLISKDVVTGKVKRIGKNLATTKEIIKALKEGGVDGRLKEMAEVIGRVLDGDLNQMKKVFNSHSNLFVAASQSGAKQKAKDVSGNSASIMNRIRDITDETLFNSLSAEKLADFKALSKKAKDKLTADLDTKALFGTTKKSPHEATDFSKSESVKKGLKKIDSEGDDFFKNGLNETASMKEGLFPTIRDIKKKDFVDDIRVSGAKKAESYLKDKIENSKKITSQDITLAKKVDAIRGTTYHEKTVNIVKRKAKQGEVRGVTEVAGQQIARKEAKKVKLEEAKEPLIVKSKEFQGKIKDIEKNVDKVMNDARSVNLDLLNKYYSDNLHIPTATVDVKKELMKSIGEVVEDVALQGKTSGATFDVLRDIDKLTGSNFLKQAKLSGAAVRHGLKASGGTAKDGFKPIKSLFRSAGAVLPGHYKTVAAVEGVKSMLNDLKAKPVWKALKSLSKQMKKVDQESFRLALIEKEVEKGREILMSELLKSNTARRVDLLVSKGVITWKQFAEAIGKGPFNEMINEASNSKDLKERAAAIRAKRVK